MQAAEAEKAAQEAQVAQEAEAAASHQVTGETMAQRNPTMTTASLKVIPIRTQMTAVPMMILIPSHRTAVKAPTVLPRAVVSSSQGPTLEPLLSPHTVTVHSAAEQQET